MYFNGPLEYEKKKKKVFAKSSYYLFFCARGGLISYILYVHVLQVVQTQLAAAPDSGVLLADEALDGSGSGARPYHRKNNGVEVVVDDTDDADENDDRDDADDGSGEGSGMGPISTGLLVFPVFEIFYFFGFHFIKQVSLILFFPIFTCCAWMIAGERVYRDSVGFCGLV